MAEPSAEGSDERLLLLAEPAPQGGPPWRGPPGVKASPGGAVRLCGELGLEEEEEEGEEDSGPEGDGEDEPLLRASGAGRRRAGAAWDKEPRAAAGTARCRRCLPRRARRGGAVAACGRGGFARGGLPGRLPCPVLPTRLEKYPWGLKYGWCAVPDASLRCPRLVGSLLPAFVGKKCRRGAEVHCLRSAYGLADFEGKVL